MKKIRILIVGIVFMLCLQEPMTIQAAEQIRTEDIDQVLKKIIPEERISFNDIVVSLLSDEEKLEVELIGDYIIDTFFYILRINKSTISYLLILIISAAIVTNFSNVFQNKQIAEVGFYMVYMLMIMTCLQTFVNVFQMMEENIANLLTFMRVLSPVYFLSMSLSTGKVSAVGFYSLILLLIYVVELVILNGLLPMAHVYLMIQILNFLSSEMYLSKLSELIEMLNSWALKTLLACVTGIGVLQGLMSPQADAIKRGAATKVVNLFPAIGDALGIAGEMMINTAVFLKNGIGMAGSILLIILSLVPVMNVGILVVIYKGMAALVQPISDKRIVEILSSVGETYKLLLKIIFAVLFLFLISIGLAAAFTT